MSSAELRRYAAPFALVASLYVASSEPAPALTLASKVVIPVHAHYTVTQRYAGEPPETFTADYWKMGGQARYTVSGAVTRTFIVTPREWIVYVVDSRAHTSTLTLSPRTGPVNRSSLDLLGPAETTAEIPFLGYPQPGKVYCAAGLAAARHVATTIHDTVPDEYLADGATGKPLRIGVELRYDAAGRLTLYQRDGGPQGYAETYAYSDFAFELGFDVVPKSVTYTRREPRAGDGRLRETYREEYSVTKLEHGDKAVGVFAIQSPLEGTQVTDCRYADEHGMGLSYRYDGKGTIDEKSRALGKN